MRNKFVFVVLVPFLLVVLVMYLFADQWIEAGLEAGGESIVGAKVEIDDLRVTINPIGIEFARLQVANPRDTWTNTVETGRVKFALNLGQLLRNKFIIETMEVNELILGTQRTTDGALPKKPEPPAPAPAPQEAGQPAEPSLVQQAETVTAEKTKSAPVFDLQKLRAQFNVDSILNVQNLRSVQMAEDLKRQISEASVQWQATLADVEQSKQRLAQIETAVNALQLNELKSVDQIAGALKNANDAYSGIKEIHGTFVTRKATLTNDIDRFTGSIRSIDDLATEDFRTLLELARLPDISMKGLGEVLLGKELLQKANEYLYWVDFAHTKVQNTTPAPPNEKPPRMKGQTIHFPAERSYPKFWIKTILISGGTDRERNPNYFYARGEVKDVSSNQKVTGLPMIVDISAEQGRGTKGQLFASFDRTQDLAVDNYRASLRGVPLAAMSLGRSDFVPSKITNASADFTLNIAVPGNHFAADANIRISGVTVEFDRPSRGTVERLVREVLESINTFVIKLRFWKKDGPFDVAFETDLDNLLAERTRKVIGDEIARLRNELRAKLDQRVAEKRKEVERLFNEKKAEVMGRLQAYEAKVNEQRSIAEDKVQELQGRLDAEKKKQEDALKKKAEDALKGVLRKR